MNCERTREACSHQFLEDGDRVLSAEVRRHLSSCGSCRRYHEHLRLVLKSFEADSGATVPSNVIRDLKPYLEKTKKNTLKTGRQSFHLKPIHVGGGFLLLGLVSIISYQSGILTANKQGNKKTRVEQSQTNLSRSKKGFVEKNQTESSSVISDDSKNSVSANDSQKDIDSNQTHDKTDKAAFAADFNEIKNEAKKSKKDHSVLKKEMDLNNPNEKKEALQTSIDSMETQSQVKEEKNQPLDKTASSDEDKNQVKQVQKISTDLQSSNTKQQALKELQSLYEDDQNKNKILSEKESSEDQNQKSDDPEQFVENEKLDKSAMLSDLDENGSSESEEQIEEDVELSLVDHEKQQDSKKTETQKIVLGEELDQSVQAFVAQDDVGCEGELNQVSSVSSNSDLMSLDSRFSDVSATDFKSKKTSDVESDVLFWLKLAEARDSLLPQSSLTFNQDKNEPHLIFKNGSAVEKTKNQNDGASLGDPQSPVKKNNLNSSNDHDSVSNEDSGTVQKDKDWKKIRQMMSELDEDSKEDSGNPQAKKMAIKSAQILFEEESVRQDLGQVYRLNYCEQKSSSLFQVLAKDAGSQSK